MAVLDPELPGRYLLGVECDGATYHSARSARDRDKLRQRVLEARGWHLHRIWSCDWWQDREGEIARLVAALEAAREELGRETPASGAEDDDVLGGEASAHESPPDAEEPVVEVREAPVQRTSSVPPYNAAPPCSGEVNAEGLRAYACEVVLAEGPIHHDLLLLRLRDAAGVGRLGSQVRADLEQQLDVLAKAGQIRRVGDAWIHGDDQRGAAQVAEPRDWSDRPAAERKIAYLSDVEIAAALRHVVTQAFGIRPQEAPREALALLGFRGVGEKGVLRVVGVLERLVREGAVQEREGWLKAGEEVVRKKE
jgi:hypothetical protein